MSDFPHILAKNYLEDATLGYDATEDPVYVLDHIADRSRLSKFKGENTTPQNIVADLGTARSCDCFVLDKDFTINGSGYAQFLVQHYSNDGQWPSGGYWITDLTLTEAGDLSSNSLPVWKPFSSAVSRRYWRLRLTGLAAAPEIFNAWLGKRIQLTFGPYGDFDPWEEESVDEPVRSAGGGFQNVHYYSIRRLSASWENLNDTRLALLDQWFEEAGQDGLNWWFLYSPASYTSAPSAKTAPVYFNSAGMLRKFAYYRSQRTGIIEGQEVL